MLVSSTLARICRHAPAQWTQCCRWGPHDGHTRTHTHTHNRISDVIFNRWSVHDIGYMCTYNPTIACSRMRCAPVGPFPPAHAHARVARSRAARTFPLERWQRRGSPGHSLMHSVGPGTCTSSRHCPDTFRCEAPHPYKVQPTARRTYSQPARPPESEPVSQQTPQHKHTHKHTHKQTHKHTHKHTP